MTRGGVELDGHPDTPNALNDLARLEMITRIEKDILIDMQICELEGWDKMEFINMLGGLLDHFRDKEQRK